MKKLLFLLVFIPLVSFGQRLNKELSFLDSYKYVVIEEYRYKSSKKSLEKKLKKAGYNVINNTGFPKDFEENPNLGLYVEIVENCRGNCESTIYFYDYNGVMLWESKTGHSAWTSGDALSKAIQPLLLYKYKYDEKLTEVEAPGYYSFDIKSEESIRKYFDNAVELDPIEGIWVFSNVNSGNYARSAIVKSLDGSYHQIHLENLIKRSTTNSPGEYIADVIKMSGEGIYMFKEKGITSSAILKDNIIEVFYPGNKALVIREYPAGNNLNKKKAKPGEWAGNGSGIIISKSGHIITSNHVIEDADEIEVEFILNEEVQKFNAEIVQADKVNDLAIIKIFDMNFDGIEELPYNFKTRTSDVGTKVYAFGYPMALTAMGKEIKITDGIISSKSGFDGDITTYQITAPIQGGNSGGPLFDDKGNFLGINSSGIRKDVADNVGYTIKSSYIKSLIEVMPKNIDLPSNTKLQSLPLTEQIKEIKKYVVLIKVK